MAAHHSPPRPLARIWTLLRVERADLWLIVFFALGVGILSLATPIAIEALVNTVANGILLQPVIVLSLIMLFCLSLAAALMAMQAFVIECIQLRLFVRVVSDFAHRLPKVQLEVYDHHHGPEIANRFFDVLSVQKALATLLLDGIAIVIATLVGMVVLALYHPALLGFDIALIIGLAILFFILGRGGIRSGIEESSAKYAIAAWLEELTRVPRSFKFTDGPRLAIDQADVLSQEYIRSRRLHFRVVFRQYLFALMLQVLASTILLGLGGYLVINRQLTLGQLVAAELIVSLVVSSFTKFGKYIESYYDICIGVEKLGVITDLPLEAESGERLPKKPGGIAVAVQDVEYEHDARVLESVSWRVEPGERIAFVGPSGAGKSLLLDLLAGLRQPTDGRIELDGIDLRHLQLAPLREQVAIVQGIDIVSGTIAENLRLSHTAIPQESVREMLDFAGLLGIVSELPDGFDTHLIPSGRPLSRGQSIRLCLARAMLAKPRLLIIDDLLDIIDYRVCPKLLDNLFDRKNEWTLLIATHRPEVIEKCDRVIRLESLS